MKAYEAGVSIDADPPEIWSVLVDAPGYATWDSGVERVEGRIAPGERLKVYSKLTRRAFPVRVTEYLPGLRMRWSGGLLMGLFRGERTFELAQEIAGTTYFRVREVYSGVMLPLILRTMPDLGQSFVQFAEGLKRRVEA
jgi:hypothetical protein